MCRKHINNRSYTQTFKSIFFFATCVFSGSSFAETINVTDEAGLRAALIQVTTNGENDVIDLGGNTIVLSYDPVTGQGGQLISLPEIVEEGIQGKTITIQNGTIERDENAPPFRLLAAPRIAGNDTLFHSLKLTNMVFKNGIADISDPATVNVNPGIPGFARGGGAVFGGRRLSIFNCQFINNRVISDPDGDPLYGGKVYGGAVYATYQFFAGRSEFIDNRIDVLPGREGLGGAVSVSAENGTSQTLFRNNSATSGGAIYGLNSGMEIKDSTFVSGQRLSATMPVMVAGPSTCNHLTVLSLGTLRYGVILLVVRMVVEFDLCGPLMAAQLRCSILLLETTPVPTALRLEI